MPIHHHKRFQFLVPLILSFPCSGPPSLKSFVPEIFSLFRVSLVGMCYFLRAGQKRPDVRPCHFVWCRRNSVYALVWPSHPITLSSASANGVRFVPGPSSLRSWSVASTQFCSHVLRCCFCDWTSFVCFFLCCERRLDIAAWLNVVKWFHFNSTLCCSIYSRLT